MLDKYISQLSPTENISPSDYVVVSGLEFGEIASYKMLVENIRNVGFLETQNTIVGNWGVGAAALPFGDCSVITVGTIPDQTFSLGEVISLNVAPYFEILPCDGASGYYQVDGYNVLVAGGLTIKADANLNFGFPLETVEYYLNRGSQSDVDEIKANLGLPNLKNYTLFTGTENNSYVSTDFTKAKINEAQSILASTSGKAKKNRNLSDVVDEIGAQAVRDGLDLLSKSETIDANNADNFLNEASVSTTKQEKARLNLGLDKIISGVKVARSETTNLDQIQSLDNQDYVTSKLLNDLYRDFKNRLDENNFFTKSNNLSELATEQEKRLACTNLGLFNTLITQEYFDNNLQPLLVSLQDTSYLDNCIKNDGSVGFFDSKGTARTSLGVEKIPEDPLATYQDGESIFYRTFEGGKFATNDAVNGVIGAFRDYIADDFLKRDLTNFRNENSYYRDFLYSTVAESWAFALPSFYFIRPLKSINSNSSTGYSILDINSQHALLPITSDAPEHEIAFIHSNGKGSGNGSAYQKTITKNGAISDAFIAVTGYNSSTGYYSDDSSFTDFRQKITEDGRNSQYVGTTGAILTAFEACVLATFVSSDFGHEPYIKFSLSTGWG